jgi:hypothetical protein
MTKFEISSEAQVPFSFSEVITAELEQAQILTARLAYIPSELAKIDAMDIPGEKKQELRQKILMVRDDMGKIKTALIADIYDFREELSGYEIIFFDSLLKSDNSNTGFDFETSSKQVSKFRHLVPGSKVLFIEASDSPQKPVTEGVLADYPTVTLEHDEEEYTLDARVDYKFTDGRKLSRLWSEDSVIKLIVEPSAE